MKKFTIIIKNIKDPTNVGSGGVKNMYKGRYEKIFDILNADSIFVMTESASEKLIGNDLYVYFDSIPDSDKVDAIRKLKNVEVYYRSIYKNGGLIAPNGKPSKLTPKQYKLVRTKAFKDWFGDWENDPKNASKVVDENGEPMLVWHGGKQSIKIFKTPTHLGTLPSAIERVNDIALWKPKFKSEYYECFINIKKPYKTIDVGIKKNWAIEMRIAKQEGCDGLTYKNLHESRGSISFLIFEPTQIKRADGTNTTFDGNNPDIRYEQGGNLGGFNYTIGGL